MALENNGNATFEQTFVNTITRDVKADVLIFNSVRTIGIDNYALTAGDLNQGLYIK